MRYLCYVAYKGTNYQGWQRQNDAITIQGVIEKELSTIFNQDIQIQCSGRTDAGVHAYGQTFHFDIDKNNLDLGKFKYSINLRLPKDINIWKIEPVSDDFHARYSAKGKNYIYRISYLEKDPFRYESTYNCLFPFDHEKFKEAITYFIGEHNFQNFSSKEEDEANFVRNVNKIEVKEDKEKGLIEIYFSGNGFMRYMIRYMIGTAIACGQDKITISKIKSLLDSNCAKRKIVCFKAPPEGLYLESVIY